MPRPAQFKRFDIVAVDQHDFSVRSNGKNYAREAPELKWRIGIIHHADNSAYPRISGVFLDERGRPTSEEFDFHPDGKNVQRVEFTTMNIRVDVPQHWRKSLVDPAPKKEETSRGKDEKLPELHPSYGQVVVSRVSGSTKLFMSPFRHQHFMRLSISRASRQRSLSGDYVFGRADLVTIDLSESQWARLLSSVGSGGGTPCTISEIGYDPMPECPEEDERAIFQAEVEQAAQKAAARLKETYEAVEKIMEKPSVTKAERREILETLRSAEMALSDSMPFVVKNFIERMGVVTDEAKVEIQAFVDNTFRKAGLQALQDVGSPISLPEHKKE